MTKNSMREFFLLTAKEMYTMTTIVMIASSDAQSYPEQRHQISERDAQ